MKKIPPSYHEEKAGIGERELIEAFERLVREDYPNPKRIGCPNKGTLRQLAALSTPKLQVLFDHIARCAPCLKDYDRLRREIKSPTKASK
jgi:hypothetical protein